MATNKVNELPISVDHQFVEELIARSNITLDELETQLPENTAKKIKQGKALNVYEYCELWSQISKDLDDECLGFWKKAVPFGTSRVISHALKYMPNARAVVVWLSEFYGLFQGSPVYRLEETSDKARIYLNFQAKSPLKIFILAMVYKCLCHVCKTNFQILCMGMRNFHDNYLEILKTVFFTDTVSADEADYIEFQSKVLDLPVYPLNIDIQDKSFFTLALLSVHKDGLENQIKSILLEQPILRFPGKRELARMLGISEQTLSRRLADIDSSYQRIKDNIRKDRAIVLLMNPELSIKEIAYQVGFDEPASFNKAFKKWTTLSPGDFRQNLFKHSLGFPNDIEDNGSVDLLKA